MAQRRAHTVRSIVFRSSQPARRRKAQAAPRPANPYAPAIGRRAALVTTALTAGVFAVSTLWPSDDAFAQCVAGANVLNCGPGADTAQNFTPVANGWAVNVNGAGSIDENGAGGDALDIFNDNDFDGTVFVDVNAFIESDDGHGIDLDNDDLVPNSTVTFNLRGDVTSSDTGSDAIRAEGFNLNFNIGPNSEIQGADDGIVIHDLTGTVNIQNQGLIAGGVNHGGTPGHEGILIANEGVPGSLVTGNVIINNTGTIKSTAAAGAGGEAISVSTSGDINITNGADGVIEGATDGIEIWGAASTDVTINNDGHIEGLGGDGIRSSFDGSELGSVDITNSSMTSIIGLDDGIEMANIADFTLNNDGGLVQGLGGDGIHLEDVDDFVDISNQGGVIKGNWDGIDLADIDGNIDIDNSQGGLIQGENAEGIDIDDVNNGNNGHVIVLNNGTEGVANSGGTISGDTFGIEMDLIQTNTIHIDNSFGGDIDGGGDDGINIAEVNFEGGGAALIIDNHGSAADPTGGTIFGEDDGIQLSEIEDGDILIDNSWGGSIEGQNEDGIDIETVDTINLLSIDNSNGGSIQGGGDDGIFIEDVDFIGADALLEIDNSNGGEIFGDNDGIELGDLDLAGGDIVINNSNGGTIRATDDEGIEMDDVTNVNQLVINNSLGGTIDSLDDDAIEMDNIDFVGVDSALIIDNSGTDGTDGGIMLAENDAVDIDDVTGLNQLTIDNSFGGTMNAGDRGVEITDIEFQGAKALLTVDNSNGGSILGAGNDGIQLEDIEGADVLVDNSGGTIFGGDGDGIHIEEIDDIGAVGGNVTVLNVGGSIEGRWDGVDIEDVDNDVLVDNSGGGSIIGEGGQGVDISDVWHGNVEVDNTGGTIEAVDGIGLQIEGVHNFGGPNTGNVLVLNNDGGSIVGTEHGAAIEADGNVEFQGEGGSVDGGLGFGILAKSNEGDVYVNTGDVTADTGGAVALAVGFEGDATVDVTGKITTDGIIGAAAIATDDGDAWVNVTATGIVDPPIIGVGALTIGAGEAKVTTVAGSLVQADFLGAGAANFGSGDVTIDLQGDIESDFIGVLGLNIGDGDTDVTINGSIRALGGVDPTPGPGVAVFASLGAGDIDVTVGPEGDILSADSGIGILAPFHLGPVTVTTEDGASVVSTEESAVDVFTFSKLGDNDVVIDNAGLLEGLGDVADTAVIDVTTDGTVTVNNAATGVIQTKDEIHGNIAMDLDSFNFGTEINNEGVITGRLLLTFEDDLFNNSGIWNVEGFSGFGVGDTDKLFNTGTIFANTQSGLGGSTTTFFGLNLLNNDGGVISQLDGFHDDVLITTGSYDGGPASGEYHIDAFLDFVAGPGDGDVFEIGDDADGVTYVVVNNTDLGGVAGLDEEGILIVGIDGDALNGADTFQLLGGPINVGFFEYDIEFEDDTGLAGFNDEFWLRSDVGDQAFELPKLITASQELFHQSNQTWLDRTADIRIFTDPGLGTEDAEVNRAESGYTNGSPGIWVRGWGAWLERDADHGNYDQDMWGAQAGVDFALTEPNAESGTFILGALVGYASSEIDFEGTEANADLDGPEVGIYGTYLNGGFFADLLVKAQFLELDYDTNFGLGEDSDSADVFSIGAVLDGGYRFNFGTRIFVEPQATLAYVHTDVDDMELLETEVDFGDSDSLRGRLGVRAGGRFQPTSATVIEPFIGVSLWNEFSGDNDATLSTVGGSTTITDDAGDTWVEVGAGVNVVDFGSGISGFVKGDYQFAGDTDGFAAQAGLRVNF